MPGPEAIVYSDSPLAEYLHEISAEDQFVEEPKASKIGQTRYFSGLVEKIKNLPTQLSCSMIEILHGWNVEPSELRKLQDETYQILHDQKRYFNTSARNYSDKSKLLFFTMVSATFIFLKPNVASRLFLNRNLKSPQWLLGSLAVPAVLVLKRSIMGPGSFDKQRKSFLTALDHYSLLSATLCASFNKSIRRIQEIELISRGYRYSNPLPPISRIDRQSSAYKQCAHLRRQLSSSIEKIVTSYMKTFRKITKCSSLPFQNELEEVVQLSLDEVLAIGSQHQQDIADSLEQLKHGVYVIRALMDIWADLIYNVTKSVTEAYLGNLAFLKSCIDGLSEKLEIVIHDIQAAEVREFDFSPKLVTENASSAQNQSLIPSNIANVSQKLLILDNHLQTAKLKIHVALKSIHSPSSNNKVADIDSQHEISDLLTSISADIKYAVVLSEEVKDLHELRHSSERTVEIVDDDFEGLATMSDVEVPHILFDCTKDDDSILKLDEDGFMVEAVAGDEVGPDASKSRLTRAERIKLQRQKRESEVQARAEKAASEVVVRELKDVLMGRNQGKDI